jgi:hypothetical protein
MRENWIRIGVRAGMGGCRGEDVELRTSADPGEHDAVTGGRFPIRRGSIAAGQFTA